MADTLTLQQLRDRLAAFDQMPPNTPIMFNCKGWRAVRDAVTDDSCKDQWGTVIVLEGGYL